jgi:hypothetical protein
MVLVKVVTLEILEVEVVQEGTDCHSRACSNCELRHDCHRSFLWKNSSQATYNENTITMKDSKTWLTAKRF